MPFQPPPHTAWQALLKQSPALENILGAVVGDPADNLLDMAGPMGPPVGVVSKGTRSLMRSMGETVGRQRKPLPPPSVSVPGGDQDLIEEIKKAWEIISSRYPQSSKPITDIKVVKTGFGASMDTLPFGAEAAIISPKGNPSKATILLSDNSLESVKNLPLGPKTGKRFLKILGTMGHEITHSGQALRKTDFTTKPPNKYGISAKEQGPIRRDAAIRRIGRRFAREEDRIPDSERFNTIFKGR